MRSIETKGALLRFAANARGAFLRSAFDGVKRSQPTGVARHRALA